MEDIGCLTLIKRSGNDGKSLPISSVTETIVIGRHPKSDVRVDLTTVSRKHAVLKINNVGDERIMSIQDFASVNHTVLDGEMLGAREEKVVRHQSVIEIAERKVSFI